jgi:hypothetical protein
MERLLRLREQRVVIGGVWRYGAADVAVLGWVLDLDDVGAEIGEVQGAEGAGAVLLDGQDPYASEGERIVGHCGVVVAAKARDSSSW